MRITMRAFFLPVVERLRMYNVSTTLYILQ